MFKLSSSLLNRVRVVAPLLLGFALLSQSYPAIAQKFEPELSETLEWLSPAGLAEAQVPADAPERTTYPMPAEQPGVILDELPGRPFHKLDPTPESAAWWKYPVYTIFGLPRDLIDSVFGFVSYVPIVNIPVVGVAYEVVPTQAIMRDPRDWHRWPGSANKRGHGFFPSKNRVRDPKAWQGEGPLPPKEGSEWKLNESWGFFPTAHSMKFTYASKAKIRKLIDENEQMRRELQEMNRDIDLRNRQIAERQKQARDAAVAAIDTGNGAEATRRMFPYHASYPTDEAAHALLINSLAVYADSGPAWARPFLYQNLSGASPGVLERAAVLLRKTVQDRPQAQGAVEALVDIETRLGRSTNALTTAEAAYNINTRDPRRARLYFETALASRNVPKATQALESISASDSSSPDLNLMRLRLDLLSGRARDAQPRLAQLAAASPENAGYHYYLGVANLAVVDQVDKPELSIRAAFDELERAALSAPTRPLRERAGRALSYARSLAASEGGRRPQPKREEGLFNIGR